MIFLTRRADPWAFGVIPAANRAYRTWQREHITRLVIRRRCRVDIASSGAPGVGCADAARRPTRQREGEAQPRQE